MRIVREETRDKEDGGGTKGARRANARPKYGFIGRRHVMEPAFF